MGASKYRRFMELEEVNSRLSDGFSVRVAPKFVDNTLICKFGLYDKDFLVDTDSRLDTLLDKLEQEMGKRWMTNNRLYLGL